MSQSREFPLLRLLLFDVQEWKNLRWRKNEAKILPLSPGCVTSHSEVVVGDSLVFYLNKYFIELNQAQLKFLNQFFK